MIRTSIFLWLLLLSVLPARSQTLDESMDFWRSKAFLCDDGRGHKFPSKERTPAADNPSTCDDGDMTLFNGLLCASGEELGCSGVKFAQDSDTGRWWRSPRRIGFEWPKNDVSFSPDQALGVLHYAVHEKDTSRFKAWVAWIDEHRPCTLSLGGGFCALKGWPRFCPDDQPDKRCTFRLGNCAELEVVGAFLKEPVRICRDVLKAYGMNVDNFVYPTALLAAGAAAVNEKDYPLHLAAVQIFLLKRAGIDTGLGGQILELRDNRNPFFVFLAEGPTARVRELLLKECPTQATPSASRSQWSWERPSSDEPWKNSMYWDCIFVGRLLGSTH